MGHPSKPTLVYDGECEFCRLWIARWRRATGEHVEYATFQESAPRFPQISAIRFAEAIHLIEPDGRRSRGAEAVFRALAYAPGRGWPLWLYARVPGFASSSEWCYRFVARRRPEFTRLTRWIWGEHVVPPGNALTSWIFLRALAIVYLAAFLSLWPQIHGLAGSRGILPAAEFLRAVHERDGALAPWFSPTVAWLGAGDAALSAICAAGAVLSLLLAAGVAPIACLIGLWAAYLSLTTVGQEFLWFQWDGLILESGFLAIFLAPWRRWSRPGSDPPPSRAAVWLLRWLLFRLMVSSAVVKLASGDPTWHGLTALRYHFETQPLPPWTAWYAHHLPEPALRAATAAVLVIEGLVPFLLFAPRRIRFAAAGTLAALQILILATGNYAFFNWLTLALCILALDDGVWPRRWRDLASKPATRGGAWPYWVLRPAAGLLFLLSVVAFLEGVGQPTSWLGPFPALYRTVSPWRTVNHYGLFAVMTVERPEIVLEGSEDGVTWLPYEFRWKPGDVMRRPGFVAPGQPRVDWQMWFAALSDPAQSPWLFRFCQRLLEGSPPVLSLLAKNPFPRAPPRYLRAVLYEYHFTDSARRRMTGAWWRRRPLGLYCPVLTLRDGKLAAMAPGS